MVNFNTISLFLKVNYVLSCVQFCLSMIGIISNILVICVFARQNMRKYAYSLYCQMKASGDIIIMLYIFRGWAQFIMDSDLDLVAPILCQFNRFNTHLASMFSLSILVFISLDRFISVMYPNRFGVIKKRWFQVIMMFLAFFYSVGLNIILPLNTSYVSSQVGNQTIASCVVSSAILTTHSWIRNCNILVIILIINNAINIRLIAYIISSRRKVANNTQNRSSKKDRKMIISAISLGFTALVCKLPLGTIAIISNYLKLPSDQASMMNSVAVTLLTFEYSAMFVVNMSVNSLFYSEFLSMFGWRHQPVGSTTGNKKSNTNQNTNNTNNDNINFIQN